MSDVETSTRPFADWLRELSRGATHEELSSGLQELTEAVIATDRAGTLTLTIKIAPAKTPGVVVVEDKVKVAVPQARAASMFYVDKDSNLRRDDPDAQQLPLMAVWAPGDGDEQGRQDVK